MKTVDFSTIFRIASDGIYYEDGVIKFEKMLPDENGYFGKEDYFNGEFTITFYSTKDKIVFPVCHFGSGENALKGARAKSGSCLIFLKEVGIKIKEYQG